MSEVSHDKEIDVSVLRKYLFYNPETGKIYWIKKCGSALKNDIAGNMTKDGYIKVTLAKKDYFAHRLAWCLFYGYWPKIEIDHINRIKTDNRISNLRDVDHSINIENRSRHCKGYTLTGKNRWRSYFYKDGKQTHLGTFDTREQAKKAYSDYLNFSKLKEKTS